MKTSTLAAIGCATAGVMAASACSAQPAVRDARGFYLTTNVIATAANLPDPATVASPTTQGVFIRVRWDSLEPRRGQFDWSLIDPVVRDAARAHKKLSIGLLAAADSPSWLSAEGVRTASFKIKQGAGCTALSLPIPWDEGYITAYLAAMRGIRDHLQTLGALDDVTIVKLTGIARTTLEMRLPLTSPCADNVPTWQSLGYRPGKIIDAWGRMADGVDRLFPGRLLSVSILEADGLPNIDDQGRTGGRGGGHTTSDIIALCIQRYARRCAVQWNALKLNGALAERVFDAGRHGATMGWQTNLFEGTGRGAGCQPGRRDPSIPCTTQTYQALLSRGVKSGATFIEVWAPNARQFPDSLVGAARDWR